MTPGTTSETRFSHERAFVGIRRWLFALSLISGLVLGCENSPDSGNSQSATVTLDELAEHKANSSGASFTGSAACAECHAETAREYHSHPMSRSLASVQKADHVEDLSNPRFSTIAELAYLVEKDANHTWHHEIRVDSEGQTVYDQRVKIDFVVGSGVRGRSYLTNSDGRLYQSPITWYTGNNSWGLSPGYSPGAHPRFDRRVTHACLACHAGRVNPHTTDPDRFAEPVFVEEAIGCERCHGAGSSHISFHRTDPSLRTAADPIVNPERFKDSRRDAVCNQCHLQGQRRVAVNGRSEFDFQPGMYLSDVWTVFLKTKGIRDGVANAVSQVEQMYASKCFQKSDGELSCISCHDPHKFPSPPEVRDHYRDRCLQCHSGGRSQCTEDASVRMQIDSDSCIKCHMPKFGAADVHSAQSDHRVLRRPLTDNAESSIPNGATPDDLVFFEEPGVSLSKVDKNRAAGIYLAEIGYLENNRAAAERSVQLLTPLQLKHPADVEVSFSLGKALVQARQYKNAMDILESLLIIQPSHEDLLETLAITYHEHGRIKLARDRYERLLELNPTRARYYGRYSHVLGQLGDYQGALEAGEKALALDPSLVQAHAWLAEICQKLGDEKSAAHHKGRMQSFKTIPQR
jgi:predicted CXXCH cytochrome family protein